jgi:hypothetical protein
VEEEEQEEEAEQEEQEGPQRLPQFLNPDPRGIRIGRKTLQEHLESCGEEGILQQRDFLLGVPLRVVTVREAAAPITRRR